MALGTFLLSRSLGQRVTLYRPYCASGSFSKSKTGGVEGVRYSLTALLAIVFLISSVLALWLGRDPWQLVGRETAIRQFVGEPNIVSPDRTRRFRVLSGLEFETNALDILDYGSGHTLYSIPVDSPWFIPEFVDNDTIVIHIEYKNQSADSVLEKRTYHRRFPEGWWGHFYRPEAWLSLILIGVILTRIARNQLQAEKETGEKDPI